MTYFIAFWKRQNQTWDNGHQNITGYSWYQQVTRSCHGIIPPLFIMYIQAYSSLYDSPLLIFWLGPLQDYFVPAFPHCPRKLSFSAALGFLIMFCAIVILICSTCESQTRNRDLSCSACHRNSVTHHLLQKKQVWYAHINRKGNVFNHIGTPGT